MSDSLSLHPAIASLERIPDVIDEIALRIQSGEPIWNVARFYGLSQGQLLKWLTTDADRAMRYAHALKAASHNYVAEAAGRLGEVVDIADKQREVEKLNADGEGTGEFYDPEVPRDRLRVDARLKVAKQFVELAGIANPAAYGPKSQVQFSGSISLDAVLTAMETAREARVVGNGSA